LIITDNEELKNLIQKNKTNNVFTKEDIEKILINYFNDNNKLVLEYKERPERVSKFFIGMVMKETKAQANPKIVLEIFNEKIKNFFEQKS
jgi:aspartyl-tRNA(Asn)/glutamyl-tRNA(Gln) amidotransferase subunit B